MSDTGSLKGEVLKGKHPAAVGRQNLADVVPPHPSYEGHKLWDPEATWTPEEERKLVRTIDWRLLSMLCLMFLGLQLDRGNLGNAVTDNFLGDLGLTTNDYNNGSSIQLVCFLATEFPFQMLIKRFGFKRILPLLMTCWSFVSIFQRVPSHPISRGFIPGTILYCTYFYTSAELAIRLALFWSTLNVARIVSALLAAGILGMRGVHGWAGWRWLFAIDGCITLAIALVAFLALPGSPVSTTGVFSRKGWFTPRQEVIAINRILRDDSSKGLTGITEALTWADVKEGWCDKSMWGLYFIGLIAYIPAAPVSGYLGLTLKALGFDTFESNMLTIPAAVIQIILMLALAFSSDFYGERTLWVHPVEIKAQNSGISGYPYFHPIVSAWISENSFSIRKRAVTAATYNVIVQMGSIVSSQIYRADDKPFYHRGNKVLIAICCLSLAAFLSQRFFLQYLNSQKLKAWNQMSEDEQVAYQNDTAAREKDGNKRLDFLFIY